MDERTVESILKQVGAYRTGHFVLASNDKHSEAYVNAARLLADPRAMLAVAELMADKLSILPPTLPEFVVCPAEAAVPLCTLIGQVLSLKADRPVPALYASKEGGHFVFKRGQADLVRGRVGVALDDVGTSGTSLAEVVKLSRQSGGEISLACYLAIRSESVTAESVGGVPALWSPLRVVLPDHEAADCPLCAAGTPIDIDLGHGAEYVAAHGQPVKRT